MYVHFCHTCIGCVTRCGVVCVCVFCAMCFTDAFAHAQDTGWYVADYSVADRLDWGRGKGCAFTTNDCSAWEGEGYECKASDASACTHDRKSKVGCGCSLGFSARVQPTTRLCSPPTIGLLRLGNVQWGPTGCVPAHLWAGEFHYCLAYDAFNANVRALQPRVGGHSELADYCPLVRSYSDALCTVPTSHTNLHVRPLLARGLPALTLLCCADIIEGNLWGDLCVRWLVLCVLATEAQ